MKPTLAVVGGINMDLVAQAPRLPGPGETVVGGSFSQHHGGKGGNQSVAASRASGNAVRVASVAAVGDDTYGESAASALADEGIEAFLETVDGPTGVALIVVDPSGENQISVAPGANRLLQPDHVIAALEQLRPAIVLASLEVSMEAVLAAAGWARKNGVTFALNPAPVTKDLDGLLPLVDILTPNEFELAAIGTAPKSVTLIETRGAAGARIDGDATFPAPATVAADTTGAGDCFNGVLAAGLAEGLELPIAVGRAVVAAALSVTKPGAREGMPTRAELDAAFPL